jgi:hypothetical protein
MLLAPVRGQAADTRSWEGGTDVFFVISGVVRALIHGSGGREVILGDIGVGEFFGELVAIDGRPRSTIGSASGVSRFRSSLAPSAHDTDRGLTGDLPSRPCLSGLRFGSTLALLPTTGDQWSQRGVLHDSPCVRDATTGTPKITRSIRWAEAGRRHTLSPTEIFAVTGEQDR